MGRYLVTGCSGFIGSKVVEHLLADGHSVVGIDNLNDAYDGRLKQWRLARLECRSDFEFHRIDVSDLKALRGLLERSDHSPWSGIINLAARAGVRHSVRDPWVHFETNVIGTLNLLEMCREFDAKKFVLASTSSVYGEDTPRPFKEDSTTSRPLSPYASSKKAAETLVYTYHHLYGLDATVLRYFTVYGPAGRPDMVVFRFIRAIVDGKPITVYGDGTQERDYTNVEDVADATIAALRPLGFEIINIGSDRPVTLRQLISTIEAIVDKKAVIEYAPRHSADVLATWASIECAERLLEWHPVTSLEDGIKDAVEWYEENKEWAGSITDST